MTRNARPFSLDPLRLIHPGPVMHNDTTSGAIGTLARLERATNAHDVDEVVACFAAHYRNETPAHPERGFTGREQGRRNWGQIFAAIPDITAKVLRSAVNGDEVWSEWEHRGTRQDGSLHLMRGVIIFGLGNELLTWARFRPGRQSDQFCVGPRCRCARGAGPGRSVNTWRDA